MFPRNGTNSAARDVSINYVLVHVSACRRPPDTTYRVFANCPPASVIPGSPHNLQTMGRGRGLSRGLAAASAAAAGAGALCLTFPQSAVARERIWGPGAVASDANFDLKSGKYPRNSLDAPRSADGVRKRLAAGIGTASKEQDVPGAADGQDTSTESQDQAIIGTCKRREGWTDDGFTSRAGDVCRIGEGSGDTVTHRDAYQGRGGEEIGHGFVGAAEERADSPFVPDDDRLGLRHRPPASREIRKSKESRGLPPGDGVADTQNLNELQPHNPWEGYQIIAQADPVASWEILREVSDSRTVHPGFQPDANERSNGPTAA